MSDNVQQALPKDDPILKAFDSYKSTPEFENARKWASHITATVTDGHLRVDHPHLIGSLWAAFTAGIRAAREIDLAP